MLVNFFFGLKIAKIPVSTKEFLILLEALDKNVVFGSVDDFYLLSRAILVKDEKYYDRFDKAFAAYFKEVMSLDDIFDALIPDDWTKAQFLKNLSEEEKAKIDALGGLEKLIDEFRKRLEEQKKRHQGGNKWIGTGGTSPFGNGGYNPEGIRVGGESRNKNALKVWDKRQFKNLDENVQLGTRNIKVALKKLRKFARTGAEDELDLDSTISSTAKNAGYLDIKMVPEKHNAVKVLLFLDVGGSMDPYINICEEMFSACKTEFKHLEYFYFHNFVYENVWKDNLRRTSELTPTMDVLHKYTRDYKVIFVGDASMSPYEITAQYGSVEHLNEEPGLRWMERITNNFEKIIWLNPTDLQFWNYTQTIPMVQNMLHGNMFPLTLNGIEQGIKYLSR